MEEILGGPGSGKTTKSIEISRGLLRNNLNVKYLSITNVSIDDVAKRAKNHEDFQEEWLERMETMTMHSYMLYMIQQSKPPYEVKAVVRNDIVQYPDLLLEGGHNVSEEAKVDWKILALTEGVEKHGQGKALMIPMDRLMSYIIAFDIRAPENDALIIDEYQDTNSYEVAALAEMFGDRVVIAGDFNQSIFLFRHKTFSPYLPIARHGKVQSYRFDQNTCDMLNRYIDMKTEIFPSNATAGVRLFSEVGRKSKVSMFRSANAFSDTERLKDIHSLTEFVQNKKSVAIITTSNFLAAMYSAEAMKAFGADNFENWYVTGNNVPIYWLLRDYVLQHIHGRGKNASLAVKEISKVAELFVEIGRMMGTERNKNVVEGNLRRILEKAIDSKLSPRQYVTFDELKRTLVALANGELTKPMAEIPHACADAKLQASRSVLEGFLENGFKVVRQGFRMWRGQHRQISVLTIHGSKGCEFDHTLVRFTTRPITKVLEFLQSINEVYVALSRHKETCDVRIPMAPPSLQKLKQVIQNINWTAIANGENSAEFYDRNYREIYRSGSDLLYTLAWLANRPNGSALFQRVKTRVIAERIKKDIKDLPPGSYVTEEEARVIRREEARKRTQRAKKRARLAASAVVQ